MTYLTHRRVLPAHTRGSDYHNLWYTTHYPWPTPKSSSDSTELRPSCQACYREIRSCYMTNMTHRRVLPSHTQVQLRLHRVAAVLPSMLKKASNHFKSCYICHKYDSPRGSAIPHPSPAPTAQSCGHLAKHVKGRFESCYMTYLTHRRVLPAHTQGQLGLHRVAPTQQRMCSRAPQPKYVTVTFKSRYIMLHNICNLTHRRVLPSHTQVQL
jgi:hypothetical protein